MTLRTCAWTGEETDEKFYVLATDGEPSELVSESALRGAAGAAGSAGKHDQEAVLDRLAALEEQVNALTKPSTAAKTATEKAK